MNLPPTVLPFFVAAGWSPERQVPLPEALERTAPRDHPARTILQSLGGLHVGTTGPGVECAKSDLEFGWLDEDDAPDVARWAETLGTRLIGVAQVHNSHGSLYVASDGRCFGLSNVHDAFNFEGPSFPEAAERLLLGLRSRPMLGATQNEVNLYGFRFTRSSPEMYLPESAHGSGARAVQSRQADAHGVASLWLGHAKSLAAFDRALVAEFSPDGDFLGSPFSRGFNVAYYEDATREATYFDTPPRSLAAMLTGCSYGEVLIPRFESLSVRLAPSDNCAVLLYTIDFRGETNRWCGEGVDLRFVGSAAYAWS